MMFPNRLGLTLLAGMLWATTACVGTNEFIAPTGSAADTAAAPLVTVAAVPRQVLLGDSVRVTATDSTGVVRVGYLLFRRGVPVGGLAQVVSGAPTAVTVPLVIAGTAIEVGDSLELLAFAENAHRAAWGAVGVSPTKPVRDSALARRDTIVLATGRRTVLPVAASYVALQYHPFRDLVLFADRAQNRLTVYDATRGEEQYSVPTGALPTGLSLVPRDALGTPSDSVLVANSGATHLSVVSLSARTATQVRLGTISVLMQDATADDAGHVTAGAVHVRSADVGDRPRSVAALCVPQLGSTSCGELMAVVATVPAASVPTPLFLVRYVVLSGPRAGVETVLMRHAADNVRTSFSLVTMVVHNATTGRDSTLYEGYRVEPTRFEPPAPFDVAATGDYGTVLGASLSDVAVGRVWTSNGLALLTDVRDLNDVAGNVGGTVSRVTGGALAGIGRIGIQSSEGFALTDNAGRLRLQFAEAGGGVLVTPRIGERESLVAVIGGTSASPELRLYDVAGDAPRLRYRTPLASGVTGPMAAWIDPLSETIRGVIVTGGQLVWWRVSRSWLGGGR